MRQEAETALQWGARRERHIVAVSLAFVAAAGLWMTLRSGDWLMQPSAPQFGSLTYLVLLFIMWWTMMMAMMLPSAAPGILSYASIARKLSAGKASLVVFALGYAAVWTAFSLAAVMLQFATADILQLTGMMAVTSKTVGGLLLVAAGIYQFTPLKSACLRLCQSPFFYIARNWKNGTAGAFRMGLDHGVYCLGCCWVLMLLLFYGGVMELTWIVGLALYVAAEKLLPPKLGLSRLSGVVLIAWGSAMLAFTHFPAS